MAPLWPYAVGAQLTLDSAQSHTVSFQDLSRPASDGGPETVVSAVVFGFTGLTNGQHELTVSFADGMQYLVLDALIYTIDDDTTSTTTSTDTTTASQTTSSSSGDSLRTTESTTSSESSKTTAPSSSSSKVLPLALGTSLGLVGLLALIGIIFLILFCLRKKQRQAKYNTHTASQSTYSAPGHGPASLDHSFGYMVEAYPSNPGTMLYTDSSPPFRPTMTPPQLYSRSPAISTTSTTAPLVPLRRVSPTTTTIPPVPPVPVVPPLSSSSFSAPSRTTATAYDSTIYQPPPPVTRPPLSVRNATPRDRDLDPDYDYDLERSGDISSVPSPKKKSGSVSKSKSKSKRKPPPPPTSNDSEGVAMRKAEFLAQSRGRRNRDERDEYGTGTGVSVDNLPLYSSQ